MSLTRIEKFEKKLLLEGKEDVFVVSSIWEKIYGKDSFTFDRIDCAGKDRIPKELRAYALYSDVKAIGIVIDADTDIESRWEKYQNELNRMGYDCPNISNPDGAIIEGKGRKPRIGIWIMPNNNDKGMIEDFIKYLVPNNNQLWIEAERILEEIEAKNLNIYDKDLHRSKAKIQTWLAWQETPGINMSTAITKSYLTTNHDLCQRFINWLSLLFNSEITHSQTH